MNDKSLNRYVVILLIMAAMMGIIILLVFFYKDDTHLKRDTGAVDYSDGWINEQGEDANLSAIYGAAHSFSKKADEQDIKGRALCFKSKNVNLEVYYNDALIYSYEPELPTLYGKGYGMMFHVISIPVTGEGGVIRIDTSPIYKDSKVYLKNMRLEYPGQYMVDMIRDNLLSFITCVILFLIGFALTVGATCLKNVGDQKVEMLSIGVFSQLAAGWTITETMILQIMTDNPSGVHFLNYMMLIFLSVPAVTFIASLTRNLNKRPVMITIVCGAVLLVINIICNFTGLVDYHNLLRLTHIYMAWAIAVCTYYIATSFRKERFKDSEYRVLLLAFVTILLSASVDIIRYTFMKSNSDSALFFRFGMLLFVLIIGIYEIYELMRYTRYQSEARLMFSLAHTDSLTGISNRTAFSEKEDELLKADCGKGLFVLLDINNLKTVNDNYGHGEGDKHIKAGAKIINDSFSPFGTCYRIGGDEFFVVIEGNDDMDMFNMALKHMLMLVDDYNANDDHPVPLQIAYGCEPYNCEKGNVRRAQTDADKKMYICKKAIKDGVM